jgi:hypothetical protein
VGSDLPGGEGAVVTSQESYTIAQMWVRNNVGDSAWQDQIATLDERTLRVLDAQLKVQMRTFLSRRSFVEMMLDLLPTHECNCNRRWTTSNDEPHAEDCERLKACTCERQWTGGGLFILDHSPDCELRYSWVPTPPPIPEAETEGDVHDPQETE